MKECAVCKRCFPDHFNNCPNDGDALKFSISGDTVLDGRYQLEKRLGHGGMGIVFKARHIFLKTAHAIKVILPDLVGNDPMLVTRFRQEAMAAAAIRHPNIIAVTDFGVVRGTMPFLVMEFVSGRSLHDILAEEKRLSPERAVEILAAVGAGVSAAHRQGIVHRDLKPLNIMLQEGQSVSEGLKVLDFGLAKIKSGELLGSFVAAQTTGLMGSPFYMAPEQWSDEEPDRRADIYSLGVILYQMLGGDVPFKGASIPAIMKKHLSDPPPPLANLGATVPPTIEAVVRRSLEKEAEKRPATVEDFISELRAAVAEAQAALGATIIAPVAAEAKTIALPQQPQQTEAQARPHTDANQLATVSSQSLSDMQWPSQPWVEPDAAGQAQTAASEPNATAALPPQPTALHETPTLVGEEEQAAQEAAARRQAGAEAARKAEAEAQRAAEEAAARQRAEEEAAALRRAEEAAARRREEEAAAAARARAAEEERQRAEAEQRQQRAAQERAAAAEAQRRAEQERAGQQMGQASQPPPTAQPSYPPPQGFTTSGRQDMGGASGGQASAQPMSPGHPPQPPPGWQSQPPAGQQSQQNFQQQSWPLMSPPGSQSQQQFHASAPGISVPAAQPKSSSMLFLIIGALVLIVAVGGGAALFLFWPSGTVDNANAGPTPAASPGASPTAETPPPPAMIEIPGGSFMMGRSGGPVNESPPHRVTVAPFAIDRTEVTNAEYAEFVSATGHRAPTDWRAGRPPAGQEQWPVRNINFDDAVAFAGWRSQRDNVTYRLPTEAEWEYAARGSEANNIFPWGPNWVSGHAAIGTAEPRAVGSFTEVASPFGVMDMIGNVWEWTSTEIEPYPGNTTWQPRPEESGHVVIRGGSYESAVGDESGITATRRNYAPPSTRHKTLGFRLVRPSA